MEIAFDPVKNRRNIVERGLGFSRAAEMDFETAIFFIDERKDYGEIRHIVVGYLVAVCTSCVMWSATQAFE